MIPFSFIGFGDFYYNKTLKKTTLKYNQKKEKKIWTMVSNIFPLHNLGEYPKNSYLYKPKHSFFYPVGNSTVGNNRT